MAMDRRSALQEVGMQNVLSGLEGYGQYKKQKEETDRSKALKAFDITQEVGKKYNLYPEEREGISRAIMTGDFGSLSSILGQVEQAAIRAPEKVLTKEYQQKLATEGAEKRYKEAQTKELEAKTGEYGKPPEQTIEGQKYLWKLNQYKNIREGGKTPGEILKKQLTPGEIKTDEGFAKEYQDFVTKGGVAEFNKSIQQLQEARNDLASGRVTTGPVVGNIPLKSTFVPKMASTMQKVHENAVKGLRQTLGAQFTEKEGEIFKSYAFDPSLPTEENISKIDKAINELKTRMNSKIESIKYFEERGTLKGFRPSSIYGQGTQRIQGNLLTDKEERRRELLIKAGQQ